MSRYIFDTHSTAAELARKLRDAKKAASRIAGHSTLKVAVLANFSTQYLVGSMFCSFVAQGIVPEIFESSFDQWEFELANPDSRTNKSGADYLVIALSTVRLLPANLDPAAFAANLSQLLRAYKEGHRGEVVIVLPESIRAGFDQTLSLSSIVRDLRHALRDALAGIALFIDIDPLIREFGFEKWAPAKYQFAGQFSCHPNCYGLMGNYIANFIESVQRRPIRLIIVDLDNTLWGGVVGDLGWENVELDKDGKGHPYLMLQLVLKRLKETGALLAIASKNTHSVARAVFDNRREMILKFEDFVATEINWEPKSANVGRILAELNLTSTGIMLLDDSPFERQEVGRAHAEIIIPELPADPNLWCEFLAKSGYLTVGKVGQADGGKSQSYDAEKRRREDSQTYGDYGQFLENLDLALTAHKVCDGNFDRVFELLHKTNQFNLTTRRHSRQRLQELVEDDSAYVFCYHLKDKYSDYGIIAVFIAVQDEGAWEIDTWLLSCRAMGRGVENAIFDHFLADAVSPGQKIVATFIPTEKNAPVEKLLETMGFAAAAPGRQTSFVSGVSQNPKATYISVTNG